MEFECARCDSPTYVKSLLGYITELYGDRQHSTYPKQQELAALELMTAEQLGQKLEIIEPVNNHFKLKDYLRDAFNEQMAQPKPNYAYAVGDHQDSGCEFGDQVVRWPIRS